MNFKTTLVLLALVAIGVALWYFAGETPSPLEEDAEPAQPETHYVLDPRPERNDVVFVSLSRADKPNLVFERTATSGDADKLEPWRMVAPLECNTESYLVDSLAGLITGVQYRRAFRPGDKGGVSLADAGLEPPVATLTVRDKEGKEYAVEIGKQATLSSDTYMRVAGEEEIKLVGRDLTRDMAREVNEYRSKRLTTFAANDARRVTVEHEGKSYDISRGTRAEWMLNSPVEAYAKEDKVKALINGFNGVRVKEFIDDAPPSLGTYGLDSPFLTVAVTTETKELIVDEEAGEVAEDEAAESEDANEPTTQPAKKPRYETIEKTYALAVGEYADLDKTTRYVKLVDRNWVASATTAQLDRLLPKLSEIRDPKVTRIKAARAKRLEIAIDGYTTIVEKIGPKWEGTGDLEQLDTQALKRVLEAFEDLTAIDYIDNPGELADYGLEQPRAVVAVRVLEAIEPVTLRIGENTPSGRNTYVQLAGQRAVMVVSADKANEVAVDPISLRSREITSFQPEEIKQVWLERGERHYALERDADGQNWRLIEPANAPPDAASIRDLVNDLARLRAKQVVAKEAEVEYGLTQPELTIRFVRPEAD